MRRALVSILCILCVLPSIVAGLWGRVEGEGGETKKGGGAGRVRVVRTNAPQFFPSGRSEALAPGKPLTRYRTPS